MSGTKAGAAWRSLLLGGALIASAAIPAQAATTRSKILPQESKAQGVAAAPDGGAYVVASPTYGPGTAVLVRYSKTGSKQWSKSLGDTDTQALGLVSDTSGNAYVQLYHRTRDTEGIPHIVQQVTKSGALGWTATWHHDYAAIGDAIALYSGRVYVAQFDQGVADTNVRSFRTSDGKASPVVTLPWGTGLTDRPVDLAVTSSGMFLLGTNGQLLALKLDGTVRWSKQLPGQLEIGAGLAADSAGFSVAYSVDRYVLHVRRYSLSGSQKWDKVVPDLHWITSLTTSGGNTYVAYSKRVNDKVKSQVVVTRYDKNGVKKASVTAGTNYDDTAWFVLVSGSSVYVAGYAWTVPEKPLIIRMQRP